MKKMFTVSIMVLAILTVASNGAILRGKIKCKKGGVPQNISIKLLKKNKSVKIYHGKNGNYTIVAPPGVYKIKINGKVFKIFIFEENMPRNIYIKCK